MRIAVYTGVFGHYDELLEQPVAESSDADFICLTDDPDFESDTWDVRVVDRAFEQDSVRSARLYKILGHESLDEYDATLYIDASVRLRSTPEEIVAEWLPDDADLAVASHSYRETLIDEFDEVIRLKYDDPERVNEQLMDYAVADPEALESQPLWTGMLVRRAASPTLASAMRIWADHVLRYSRRDQLSFPVALAQSGVAYRAVDLDNFSSDVHEWPIIRGRRVAMGKVGLPTGPIVAEWRRERRRAEELEAQVRDLQPERVHELEREIQSLNAQISQGHAERAVLEERAQTSRRELGAIEERWRAVLSVPGAARHLRRVLVSRLRRPRS